MKILINKNIVINENLKKILEDNKNKIILEIDINELLNKISLYDDNMEQSPYLSSYFNINLINYLGNNSIKLVFQNSHLLHEKKIYKYFFKDEAFLKILSNVNDPENILFDNINLIEYLVSISLNDYQDIFPYKYIFKMNIDKYLDKRFGYFIGISSNHSRTINYVISYLLKKIKEDKKCNKYKLYLCKLLLENNNDLPTREIFNKLFFETCWDNHNELKMKVFEKLICFNNDYNKFEKLYLHLLN